MTRPLAVLRAYWDEILVIEEWAEWMEPEYVEVKI